VALGAATAGSAVTAGTRDCTAGADWGTARQSLAPAVLNLVNAHRAALGLSKLRSSPTLTASALWKARHMAKYGYFAHDDPAPPVARSAFQRMTACGYAGPSEGENIADGFRTPESVMTAWLNSPGHRANLENPTWAVIGIGVAQSASGVVYWVQDFGSRDDSAVTNRAPVAHPDRRAVARGHKVAIRVLRNDRDPDGDSLAVVRIRKEPRHGHVWLASGGRVVYRPYRGFVGRDRFRYQAADGKGGYSTAAVVVRVRG
jgi:uncharacterized protein YkwD